MKIINKWTINFSDSASMRGRNKIGSGTGERQYFVKTYSDGDYTEFNAFFIDNVKFFFVMKKDMEEYLRLAYEEYQHPTQNYRRKADFPAFYNENLAAVSSLISEYIRLHFHKGDDKVRAYLILEDKDTGIYSRYLWPILIPNFGGKTKFTQLEFTRIESEKTNKAFIYMKPVYIKEYSVDELADILKRYIKDESDLRTAVYSFVFRMNTFIKKGMSLDAICSKASAPAEASKILGEAMNLCENLRESNVNLDLSSFNLEKQLENDNDHVSTLMDKYEKSDLNGRKDMFINYIKYTAEFTQNYTRDRCIDVINQDSVIEENVKKAVSKNSLYEILDENSVEIVKGFILKDPRNTDRSIQSGYQWKGKYSAVVNNYEKFLQYLNSQFVSADDKASIADADRFCQTGSNIIYFGAPGTGKSTAIDNKLNKDGSNYIRTTFHPDTDYAAFIGCYKPTMAGKDIEYSFVEQSFLSAYVNAWNDLTKPYYLVIEEINRGNCAQIFGDVFQLLDRDDVRHIGFSKYYIKIDRDISAYLRKALSGNSLYEKVMKDFYQPNLEGGLSVYDYMAIPGNLTIYATMNTSDQSLFPMDSAFKRRWDWIYVPIDENNKDIRNTKIELDEGEYYSWSEFLNKVNQEILEKTESADKQLGPWFIKPDKYSQDSVHKDVISFDKFLSKVIFFLFDDAFKDSENFSDVFRLSEPLNQPIFYSSLRKDGKEKERVRNFLTKDIQSGGLELKIISNDANDNVSSEKSVENVTAGDASGEAAESRDSESATSDDQKSQI